MINHSKKKEKLLKELEELKLENASLKTRYEQDINERKKAEEALRKSEAELNEAQHLGQLGSWDFDAITGKITRSNEYYRIYGLDPKISPTGFEKHVKNYLPESSALLDNAFKKCLRTGEGYQLDLEYLRTNGMIYWITERGEAKRDESGRIVGLRGTAQDITERKDAEKEIVMLAQSLRSINECVCITDIKDKLIFVNQSFLNTYGYCEEELIGKHISIVRSSDTAPSSVEEVLFATTRGGWQGRLWNKRKNGSEFLINLSTTIIDDKEGKPLGLIGIATDITERIQAEETLKESQSLYHSFIEQLPNAVFRKDLEDRYVLVNSQFCRLKGLKKEDFIGKTPMEVATKEIVKQGEQGHATKYANLGEDIHEQILQTGKFFEKEEEYPDIDVGIQYMHVVRMPVFDAAGRAIGSQGIMFDVTRRRQAELIVQQQNNQLQELNATKDKFFSIIAHDLKSPFHGFLGLTKIMVEEATSFTAEELADMNCKINQSANNLFTLLKNLLEWAQMQDGSMSFQKKDISISDLIAENVALIKERSAQKGITIINEISGSVHAFADDKMINSVSLNLLSNAVKFTHRDGTVTIKAKKTKNNMIEISVNDTGVGMGKSDIEKLFKIGEKTGTKGTEGELSTGLGLLLCKEFVEKHGGQIWVESQENIGSTFYFTLPAINKNIA
jgi:PAS domain S-box-containing protein